MFVLTKKLKRKPTQAYQYSPRKPPPKLSNKFTRNDPTI